jgi:DMSO/TMAO reductase YedYZ molybdopterin-dependent catalytic subunit
MASMKKERIPPRQHVTDGFPVLNVERPMKFDRDKWRFHVTGEVDNPLELSWEQFLALPSHKIVADFHCVTGWSRLDNEWEGVLGKTICETAGVRSIARYVIMIADSGFMSNTSIDAFLKDDTILAYKWAGKDLEPKHGGPLRSVVSSIYAYKSVKWLVGLKFAKADEPGYWEVRGYHNEADPWKEQRYSFR